VFLPSDRAWDNLLRELGWSTQQLLTQQPLDSLRDVIEVSAEPLHLCQDVAVAVAVCPYFGFSFAL
jgi:hypothetical protein